MKKPTVALALGSGAARGYVHIGVIKAIEDAGYEIIAISGCSIGAIVGGVYAAGKLAEYEEWVISLDRMDVIKLLDMSIMQNWNVKGDKIFRKIEEIIGNPNIESLKMPFTSVAVDILKQKEFWFQKGSLIDAMRASSAIPSIVVPFKVNQRVYVDGGVLNPLPIIPMVTASADKIIAVDLNGSIDEISQTTLKEENSQVEWFRSIKNRFFNQDADANNGKEISKPQDSNDLDPDKWGRFQIINMMVETMQESLTHYKIAGYPPDLLISIPKDKCAFYEFWRAEELIDFGYQTTKKLLADSNKTP